MKLSYLIAALLITTSCFSQSEYLKYSWNSLPVPAVPDTIRSVHGTVLLLERRITDVYINEEDNFEEIDVIHKKFRLETEDAIDIYNKIYIPVGNVLEVVSIKARFIAPSGKITDLPGESIHEIENMDNQGDYKTFVIEGAETGGELEYIYILRKNLKYSGSVTIQDIIPKAVVEVRMQYPEKLVFMLKGYNGFPGFQTETSEDGIVQQKAIITYIPSLEEERYSYYKANLMRYEFTLAYNNFISPFRTYSWTKACQTLYGNTFELDKKETSAVRSLLKKLDIPETGEEKKIRAIENWVKANISIDGEGVVASSLDQIIKTRQSDKFGVRRLLIALYSEYGIPVDLVLTSNKQEQPFDPQFNSYNFLNEQLLYFPTVDKFMVPDDESYRLGPIPEDFQGTFGLFTQKVVLDEQLQSLSYDIKRIPFEEPVMNTDSMFNQITIDLAEGTLHAKSRRVFTGLNARAFQSFWHLLAEERKSEILSDVFNMGQQNTNITSYQVNNALPEHIGILPLEWNLDITAHSLVEQASEDILVHIGETIGTQSELYMQTARKLPVEVGILRNYYREIRFIIPEGYSIVDLSNLEMDVRMLFNDRIGCIFQSKAALSGNELIITSIEYYNDPTYPVDRYNEFRNVINAAADFNKKTVLLRKL